MANSEHGIRIASKDGNIHEVPSFEEVQAGLNCKQNKLTGTGFVKSANGVITYEAGTGSTDISGKADKVAGAVNGNLASLNASGNLQDSGKKAADFAPASQSLAATANTDVTITTPAVASQTTNGILQTIWNKIRSLTNNITRYRMRKYQETDISFDDLVQPGFYRVAGSASSPNGGGTRWVAIVLGSDPGISDDPSAGSVSQGGLQIAHYYHNGNHRLYYRGRENNASTFAGSPWKNLAIDEDISAINANMQNKVDRAGDTMTGQLTMADGAPLKFGSNTENIVGDDVSIGDCDRSGTLAVKGKNGNGEILIKDPDDAWQSSAGFKVRASINAKLDKPGGGNSNQLIQGDGGLIAKEALQRLFSQGMVSGNPADGRSGSMNSLNLYSGMGWISVDDGSGPDGNGWYGFVSIRHRGGSGDGNKFGHLLAMKRGSNRVWVKNYDNSTTGSDWTELARLLPPVSTPSDVMFDNGYETIIRTTWYGGNATIDSRKYSVGQKVDVYYFPQGSSWNNPTLTVIDVNGSSSVTNLVQFLSNNFPLLVKLVRTADTMTFLWAQQAGTLGGGGGSGSGPVSWNDIADRPSIPLSINNGGTGANSASDARASLGAAASGSKTMGTPSSTDTVLKVNSFNNYTLDLTSVNVGGASHTHSLTI
jgi:hypothetical protein